MCDTVVTGRLHEGSSVSLEGLELLREFREEVREEGSLRQRDQQVQELRGVKGCV